ncbi:ATP-grasp fold amidoligase family protein [Vreelandella alkaliphila]
MVGILNISVETTAVFDLEKMMSVFESDENQLADLEKEFLKKTSVILKKNLVNARKGEKSCEKVLKLSKPENVTSSIFSYAKKNSLVLDGMASFKRSISLRHYASQIHPWVREWRLNDKMLGCYFVSKLGVEIPNFIARGTLKDCFGVCQKGGVVLKPVKGSGSRFVYLIYSSDSVYCVKSKKWGKLNDIFEDLQELILSRKLKNSWLVEELVLENAEGQAARDLKFYCFYGKCALVLEIKRSPSLLHCFWLPDGRLAETGKYKDSSFIGDGFLEEQVKKAEMLSKHVPSPFMRIDFLKSSKSSSGMVFGEFTPSPGTYEDFNSEYDMYLGRLFSEAEASLFEDIYNGKKFDILDSLPKRHEAISLLTDNSLIK